ncbi:MAG: hypothetical protein ACYDCN_13340 [Bacteroidia bacterium]
MTNMPGEWKSKEAMQAELDMLCEVDLVDFLCKVYEYEIDDEKTRKENINPEKPKSVFVYKDMDPANDNYPTKLLISRVNKGSSSPYLYKNILNDRDCGNIFSFIKRRETDKYSIPFCKKKINNYLKNLEKDFYK